MTKEDGYDLEKIIEILHGTLWTCRYCGKLAHTDYCSDKCEKRGKSPLYKALTKEN